jgi:hypothetical protein
MYRFVVRHGLVRLIGGRAVPAMLLWDLAVLANRTRRIPIVDRGLRRGIGVARRAAVDAVPDAFAGRSVRRRKHQGDPGPDGPA